MKQQNDGKANTQKQGPQPSGAGTDANPGGKHNPVANAERGRAESVAQRIRELVSKEGA